MNDRRPPTADRWRTTGRGPQVVLGLLGCGSALLYLLLLLRFPLWVLYSCPRTNLDKLTRVEATPARLPLASYSCPTQNLDNLTRPDLMTGLALLLGILLLFGAYALGALALRPPTVDEGRRTEDEDQGVRPSSFVFGRLALIGFPLLFLALLLLVYPATSVDLYDYLFRGRMAAHYAANTFIQTPEQFRSDPLFQFVAWQRAVTAYGPLWEWLSWLTARLAGETRGASGATLLRLMLAFKALGGLGFLLCGAAIWGALGRLAPRHRRMGLYLWLWNPLALWESAGAGHNDAWMALFIVLAVWAFSARQGEKETRRPRNKESEKSVSLSPSLLISRSVWAFLALTAGGLIKFLSLFLGPVLLGAALRRLPTWRARIRLVLLGGLACLAVAALAYAPFWAGWGTFRNFGDRVALFTATWLAVLQAELVARGVDKTLAQQIATTIGLWLLLAGTGWATWRAWQAPRRVAAHALWLLLWFLLVCNTWFQPWYLFWPLALVALQPWRSRALLAIGLLCCSAMLGCYVAWSFLRPQLGWDVESASWNALLCILIYGPPLLAIVAGRYLRAGARPERATSMSHLEQRLEIGD